MLQILARSSFTSALAIKGTSNAAHNSFLAMLLPHFPQSDVLQHIPEVPKLITHTTGQYSDAPHQLKRLVASWQPPRVIAEQLQRSRPESCDLNRPDYSSDYQRQVGVLVHQILYKIALDGLEKWQHLDLAAMSCNWRNQLLELGLGGIAEHLIWEMSDWMAGSMLRKS